MKLSKEFLSESKKRGFPHKGSKFIFVLTEGYSGKYRFDNQNMLINYCPFCGKELKKYYAKELYVNEINHIW